MERADVLIWGIFLFVSKNPAKAGQGYAGAGGGYLYSHDLVALVLDHVFDFGVVLFGDLVDGVLGAVFFVLGDFFFFELVLEFAHEFVSVVPDGDFGFFSLLGDDFGEVSSSLFGEWWDLDEDVVSLVERGESESCVVDAFLDMRDGALVPWFDLDGLWVHDGDVTDLVELLVHASVWDVDVDVLDESGGSSPDLELAVLEFEVLDSFVTGLAKLVFHTAIYRLNNGRSISVWGWVVKRNFSIFFGIWSSGCVTQTTMTVYESGLRRQSLIAMVGGFSSIVVYYFTR